MSVVGQLESAEVPPVDAANMPGSGSESLDNGLRTLAINDIAGSSSTSSGEASLQGSIPIILETLPAASPPPSPEPVERRRCQA